MVLLIIKCINSFQEWHPISIFLFKGGDIQPKRDLSRFVRWPKYIRLQRQRAVLYQRLKVPPSINQFTQTLDKQTGWYFEISITKTNPRGHWVQPHCGFESSTCIDKQHCTSCTCNLTCMIIRICNYIVTKIGIVFWSKIAVKLVFKKWHWSSMLCEESNVKENKSPRLWAWTAFASRTRWNFSPWLH